MERWQYEKAFPHLKRYLALMYETLQLYSPVFFIPRYTNNTTQSLAINGREYTIPVKTYVSVNSIALHTMPRYWGSDSMVWRPNRWIPCSQDAKGREDEKFLQPTPGSYVPWANGPRICPGKKFSQVEFVAVISCLLRRYRVEPVLLQGESPQKGLRAHSQTGGRFQTRDHAEDEPSRKGQTEADANQVARPLLTTLPYRNGIPHFENSPHL